MPNNQIASVFPGLRVLVVEDLIALAIQYRTLAARLEVQVMTAGTMAEAMRQVQLGPWHAALADLNLPDGSGFASELLTRDAREDGKQFSSFSPEALAALRAYAWPGNVRELINVVRAAVALNDGAQVQAAMLPASVRRAAAVPTLYRKIQLWTAAGEMPGVASA